MQSGFLDEKVKSIFAKHDLTNKIILLLLSCKAVVLSRGSWSTGDLIRIICNFVRSHQMENNEGYDGGQKRDRVICLQRIDERDLRHNII